MTSRFLHVVYRNYRVWRKLLAPSITAHFVDPLIWLVGLGFGIGAMLPSVGGMPYLQFLGSGMICYGVMNSTTFEALWSAFTRLKQQRTWEGILHAPMTVADIVHGEWVWAALKGTISGTAILLVMVALGLVKSWLAVFAIPVMLLTGLAFSGLALVATTRAKTYDGFMYYFTLFITPMMMLSGVFFPISQLPAPVQVVAQFLPLTHAVTIIRGLTVGTPMGNLAVHLGALVAIAVVSLWIARRFAEKRLYA